jgi:lysozyme
VASVPTEPVATDGGGDAPRGTTKGIDISNHQASVDWQSAKSDGVKVAYLKASEGKDFEDDTYESKRDGAAKAGVVTGAYDFARPGSSTSDVREDARREAEHFLAASNVKQGDLAPVLDLEDAGSLTPDELALWTETWVDTVAQKTGARPMIYTSPGFWDAHVNDDGSIAEKTDLWVAHWGVDSPDVPGKWDTWSVWQKSSAGGVKGLDGSVDVNEFRDPSQIIVGGSGRTTQVPEQRQPQQVAPPAPKPAPTPKPEPMPVTQQAPAPPPPPVQQVAQTYSSYAQPAGCCSCCG